MSIKKLDLEAMSVDDLWSLHEKISRILSARITSEKHELEKRLAVLNRGRDAIEGANDPRSLGANGKARRRTEGLSKVSQSSDAVRDMVGPWEAATLVGRRNEIRSQDRRFQD